MLYHCVVKAGHCGTGRHIERSVWVHARNSVEAMRKAKYLGGVKKGHLARNAGSVLSVEPAFPNCGRIAG